MLSVHSNMAGILFCPGSETRPIIKIKMNIPKVCGSYLGNSPILHYSTRTYYGTYLPTYRRLGP